MPLPQNIVHQLININNKLNQSSQMEASSLSGFQQRRQYPDRESMSYLAFFSSYKQPSTLPQLFPLWKTLKKYTILIVYYYYKYQN